MNSELATRTLPNKMADLAFRASLMNLIGWLPIAIPNVLHSFWSWIFIVAILLSTVVALGAGMWGLLKGRASERVVGRSLFGVMVGGFNMILIVLTLIAIYALSKTF